jgi:hypothetical protein
LVLWSFSHETIIPHCKDFEEKLAAYVWRTRGKPNRQAHFDYEEDEVEGNAPPAYDAANDQWVPDEKSEEDVPAKVEKMVLSEPPKRKKKHWWSMWKLDSPVPEQDTEKAKEERKLVLLGPFYAGCGAALACCKFQLLFGVLHAQPV